MQDEASRLVSTHLRAHKDRIIRAWEQACQDLPGLEGLPRSVLIDHLPEVLDGLADWVSGDEARARALFELLAEGHAAQRVGHGVDLTTVTTEYVILRRVVLRDLIDLALHHREPLIRLNEGLDEAIYAGVRRYHERRDHQRDRFVAILGHDLRNPLGSITMASAQILATTSNDRIRRLATAITRSADRMTRMVGAVLDFTRAHLGDGIPADPHAADMGEMCEEAAVEIRAAHPDRPIEVTLHGDLSGTWDRDRVVQAISNLLANAVQHGHDPIHVVVREDDDRRAVTTEITNAGPGISDDKRHGLFDPFRGGSRGGLGLGLFIVQQIAIAHGTTCEVRSTAGATTFSIRWPRAPRDETPGRP